MLVDEFEVWLLPIWLKNITSLILSYEDLTAARSRSCHIVNQSNVSLPDSESW